MAGPRPQFGHAVRVTNTGRSWPLVDGFGVGLSGIGHRRMGDAGSNNADAGVRNKVGAGRRTWRGRGSRLKVYRARPTDETFFSNDFLSFHIPKSRPTCPFR